MNLAGDFSVEFFGPFSLEKNERKNPPKTPRQNSNRNLGVVRPKSTLQGSGLDSLQSKGGKFGAIGSASCREKKNVYQYQSPPPFSKKAMQWGNKWPVRMNLPFFSLCKLYRGGGGRFQNQTEKKIEKCIPAGTGTKIYFSRVEVRG